MAEQQAVGQIRNTFAKEGDFPGILAYHFPVHSCMASVAYSPGTSLCYCATRHSMVFASISASPSFLIDSPSSHPSYFATMSKKQIPEEVLDNPWSDSMQRDGGKPSNPIAGHEVNNTVTNTPNNDAPPVYSSGLSQPAKAFSSMVPMPGLPNLDFAKY